MEKYLIKEHSHLYGVRKVYKLSNGIEVSAIKTPTSYGGDRGLWEAYVIDVGINIKSSTLISNDPVGWLTDIQLDEYLKQLNEL